MSKTVLEIAWRVVAVAFLCAGVPALTQDNVAMAPPSTGAPHLELTPASLDFGEVWQGERAAGDFTIRNVGTAPLTLALKTSCGCTVATKPRTPLLPGESDTFRITYDTLKRKGKAQQQVTITTNDPEQPSVRIAVSGEVKPLYSTSPAQGMVFDRLASDSRVSQSIRIQSKYEGPLHLRLREQEYGPFAVELKEIQPGVEYELTATTKPPLTDDFARATVLLDTDVARSPEIHIPIHATVQQDVSVRPKLLRAQRMLITPREEMVTVTYRANSPIRIAEVRPSAANIRYELLPQRSAREGGEWVEQDVRVTLPPGDQLPTGDVFVTILTDAREPRFREFRIPVIILDAADLPGQQPPKSPVGAESVREERPEP